MYSNLESSEVSEQAQKKKKLTGRPTKLKPDVQQRIISAIRGGNTLETAAAFGGVTYSCFREWVKKGEAGRKPFVELFEAVKKAESESEIESVSRIKLAARGGQVIRRVTVEKADGTTQTTEEFSTGQWQADAWFLERRHSGRWARRDRNVTTNLTVNPDDLTNEQLARIALGEDPTLVLADARLGEGAT